MASEGRDRRLRRFAGWIVVALLGVVGSALSVPPAQADTVPINLLTINDFHGHIDANTLRFAGTMEKLRSEAGAADTLLIGGGDFFGASLYASASQQDQPTIDLMNELGVDASAVGNHELDKGLADLTDRVVESDGAPNAQWDYLAANVYLKGTTTPALPEYGLYQVGGVTVGVIGAITQQTASLVSPAGVSTVDFGDPVDAVNRVAAQLSDGDAANGEAQILVASIHSGALHGSAAGGTLESEVAKDAAFGKMVDAISPAVDAIVNGHTHQTYAWDAPVPGEPDRTRPIIQSGSNGETVGQIELAYDKSTGEVANYTVANIPTLAGVGPDAPSIAAANAELEAQLLADYPALSAVKATLDAATAQSALLGSQPVGTVTADITTAFSGGTYSNGVYGGTFDSNDRSSESALGAQVANALRDAANQESGSAQIGVVNPGALRADLLYGGRGIISFAEADAVLPSAMSLATLSLTGIQFKQLLEQQWQSTTDGSLPSQSFLQLGLSENVSYTFDPNAAPGSHITTVMVDSQPLAANGSYRISTLSYLAAGGDNFRVMTEGADIAETELIDRDAWIAYLTAHPNLAPTFARRSVAISGLRALPAAGSIATLQVSSLDMTSLGAPANTSLAVQLVSSSHSASVTDLGNFPVSAGAATVTFTVPNVDAEYLLMKATPSNTEVRVPLQMIEPAGPDPGLPGIGVSASAGTWRIALGVGALLAGISLTVAILWRRRHPARGASAGESNG